MPDPDLPHLDVHTATYSPLPEYGGAESILHTSTDGHRVAGTFRHSGTVAQTMTYDECFYVVAGAVSVSVGGGPETVLAAGGLAYLRQGLEVELTYSDDYHGVAVLMSDAPIGY